MSFPVSVALFPVSNIRCPLGRNTILSTSSTEALDLDVINNVPFTPVLSIFVYCKSTGVLDTSSKYPMDA